MTTATITQPKNVTLTQSITTGAIAGLGGGVLFGMLMGMMGMLPMVGMLVRQESAIVGFVVHLVISAILGALYGFIAGRLPYTWTVGIVGGAVFGIIWWILGALISMPLMLGMNDMVMVIGQAQWMSLMGHMIYGIATGLLFVSLCKRLV